MNVFKLLSFGVIFYAAIDNQHLFPIVGIAFLPRTNSHLYWRAQIIGKFPFLLFLSLNKASGDDGIPVELFQILKDDVVKVLHSICQQIWKTQQCP